MGKLRVMGGQARARLAVDVPVRRTTMPDVSPILSLLDEGSNTLVRAW